MTNIQPYPYQLEDLERLDRDFDGRALVSWSMGLGKTILALLYAQRHPELRPAVIVCPSGLRWQWEREAKVNFGLRAVVLETTRPPRRKFPSRIDLLIVSYDILGQRKSPNCGPGWLDFLLEMNPQLMILDECQAICNRATLRSKSVAQLCKASPAVLGLSGTPLTNRPSELWFPTRVIKPRLFPSFFAYAHRFCKPRRTQWGWDFSGSSNLKKLNKVMLRAVMIRRRKEDVLKDLPPKQRSIVPLDLSSRKEYDHALHDFIGWLNETSPAKARRAARAETIVQLAYLKQLVAKLKLPAVFTWVDDFLAETDEKLILFAIHRKIIARIHERYGNESVVVDGSVTGRKRQQAVDQFLLTKKTRLFIGNIKAAGAGWSARGVSVTGVVELPWDPGSLVQACDRTHGIKRGQEGVPSQDYIFMGRGTIDERHWKLLVKKQKILSAALDGGRGEDFDLIGELTKSLLKETAT